MKMPPEIKSEQILIIKLGALGDLVQAMGAMRAIRAHHPQAYITVLTTKPYASLVGAAPYIDRVFDTGRPRTIMDWVSLVRCLRRDRFNSVYDLQNSDRSAVLCALMHGSFGTWVGAMPGATIRNRNPNRSDGLSIDGHRETLALAGITAIGIDTLEWLRGETGFTAPQKPYALMVPGSAASRPEKRWPAAGYGALALWLMEQGVQPVLIGTTDDQEPAHIIEQMAPGTLSLIGKTQINDLPDLAREAVYAVGNDTGPMHVIAATGCPTLALYHRSESHVRKHGLSGAHVRAVECDRWDDVTPQAVMQALATIGDHPDHRQAARSIESC